MKMPETDMDLVSKEWLQSELRSAAKDLIILDCRSSNEYTEGHIRSAVNFSIPSMMLRRLAAGKIDLISTVKSRDLKQRIQSSYKISLFVLYNDSSLGGSVLQQQQQHQQQQQSGNACTSNERDSGGGGDGGGGGGLGIIKNNNNNDNTAEDSTNLKSTNDLQQKVHHSSASPSQSSLSITTATTPSTAATTITNFSGSCDITNTTTINVLHRRLKQDGCRVVCLQDGFSSFRDAFPEWCEEDSQNQEMESSRGTAQTDQLMGLRSLRISTPQSDSACSSSTESSDCESTTHHHFNGAPVEIVPGLFLGNASHSEDSGALQKYNIKYVLNVTPDLPNVFEGSGGIQYLQIPIIDHCSQDLAVYFPRAIQFIEEARSKNAAVLVHCLAGVSRSVTVTLAYLMHTRSLCLNDAFSLVRGRKPDISPNFHFMQQLHSFERQIRISPNRTTLVTSTKDGCDSCPRTKFSCACIESECKCMQTEFLAHAKAATGVSPDSGIEFDRWTPSDGGGLK